MSAFDLGRIKSINPGDSTTPCTYWIDRDEKVLMFLERNLTPAVASGLGRRYAPFSWVGRPRMRIAWVNRGDVIHEYHSHSPHPFDTPDLHIITLWESTYAECLEMSDEWATNHCSWEIEVGKNLLGESRLVEQYLEQVDEEGRQLRNASTVGPFITKQRNDMPESLQRRKRRRGV